MKTNMNEKYENIIKMHDRLDRVQMEYEILVKEVRVEIKVQLEHGIRKVEK